MRRTFIASTVLHDKENIEAVNNQSQSKEVSSAMKGFVNFIYVLLMSFVSTQKQDSNNTKRTRETTHNQDAFKKPKTTSVPSRK
jgi:hypothetical protein